MGSTEYQFKQWIFTSKNWTSAAHCLPLMIVLFAANRSCCSARSSVTGNSCICYCVVVLCGAKGQAFILVLLDRKSQEVDHARPWDATKMQLKQPKLGLESTLDYFLAVIIKFAPNYFTPQSTCTNMDIIYAQININMCYTNTWLFSNQCHHLAPRWHQHAGINDCSWHSSPISRNVEWIQSPINLLKA